MMQECLFHEDVWQALTDCVRALGGAKEVGIALRPELGVLKSQRWLLDCLNPDRADKLSLDQALWILTQARQINCHAGMAFIARQCGYADPQPVEPEDERAALQREFIKQSKAMQALATRMERSGLRVMS